jgi:glycine betaine/proline transport system substrate-binding protein
MQMFNYRILAGALVVAAGLSAPVAGFADQQHPGAGVSIQPGQDNNDTDNFQTQIVIQALRDLGYEVKDVELAKFAALHLALASGDITFIADHWTPLHDAFYEKAGGDAKMSRVGSFISGAVSGYLIDTKTAKEYGITNIGQLKDPKLAKLFDTDGDGKADLAGCVPGWGCETIIEHQLDAYKLRDTVTDNRGEYNAIIADTIARYKEGKPILYYGWVPYWVAGVLVPGKDVTWLEVPFSSNPSNTDTKLPNGKDYGQPTYTIKIAANKEFVTKNPAAAKLFETMTIPVADVSAENLLMNTAGEGDLAAAKRHAAAWIAANKTLYDTWLDAARAAAK